MAVARLSWPGMDMAVVSDEQVVKKFGPQVPWETLRARRVCVLTLEGLQCHRQLKCQDPTCFCVTELCAAQSHSSVGHGPQAAPMF